MILNEITEKLKEIDEHVFYGMVDPVMQDVTWDYIVFNRTTLAPSQNRTSYTNKYSVHVVRENFIPDGLELAVINKMLEIDGMRLAGGEGTYDYVQKPNTNAVVEMFSVDFVKPLRV